MPEVGSERVFLIGMVGSGKTTVGRALAERTGWPYVDNDDLVRRLTGREPAEIDATDGEDVLHLAELRALDVALEMEPPVVVGVAGVVVDDDAAREALREGGHVVWLRARPETLLKRIGTGAGRRDDAADPDWIRARLREREPRYAAVASQIIDVDDVEPAEIAELIVRALAER
ncbi:MAG TPA: shikimate kinase [Candidatus Limnocylindrales bacterium]|nr:shikimate kinase [Candidatus Limnocylindrales bacterium]